MCTLISPKVPWFCCKSHVLSVDECRASLGKPFGIRMWSEDRRRAVSDEVVERAQWLRLRLKMMTVNKDDVNGDRQNKSDD